jgi:hypothetical protein
VSHVAWQRVEELERVLRELVDAGEPFITAAFPQEKMTGGGLRRFNRWLAAMNDARSALRS